MTFEELLKTVKVGESTALSVVDDPALKGAKKITVECRKLNTEEPRKQIRQESAPRSHVFTTATSLAEYLKKYGTDDTVVYVDVQTQTMKAIVNEKAHNGVEILELRLQTHPLWQPWADLLNKPVGLRQFADSVADNRRVIAKPEPAELAMIFAQVKATRTIEIFKGKGAKSLNGLMIKTEIQGDSKNDYVDLPEMLELTVPLFVGGLPERMQLDLSIYTSDQADEEEEIEDPNMIMCRLSPGTSTEARLKAFDSMIVQVKAARKDLMVIYGMPRHGTWTYLPEPK